MRIHIASVLVDDQEKALRFYTDMLGFVLKHDLPAGEYRWLTLVSPEGPEDVELLLEPVDNPEVPAREFQRALYDAGVPWTSFAVEDVQQEYDRLSALGVVFTEPPTPMGDVNTAVFEDTCGNLIMLVGG